MESQANKVQVGGSHYKSEGGEEHWDRVHRLKLDYYQACITKYVERCWLKGGIEDLRKAHHFLEKYIELKCQEEDVKAELRRQQSIANREFLRCSGEGIHNRCQPDFCRIGDADNLERMQQFLGEPTRGYVDQDQAQSAAASGTTVASGAGS